jgi:hypothetical protein
VGNDGRTQPLFETTVGLVLEISTSDIYFLENHEKGKKFNAAELIDWARNGRAALCGPISVDITLAHPKPPALLLQH